jgi:tetratricopeptide (TPR) repeat protein
MIDNIIDILTNLKETETAFELLRVLGKHAIDFEQYEIVAKNLFKIKKYEEAKYYTKKCLEFNHLPVNLHFIKINLVNIYIQNYEPEEAIKLLDTMDENVSEVQLKKSYCLFLLGKLEESENILREILKNKNNDEETINNINFNLNVYEFYRDNLLEGLYRFLIFGKKINLWKGEKLPFNEWDGICRENEIIVLKAEAGIGDEFVNVRFMNHLKKFGVKPIWFSDRKEIVDIFNRNNFLAVSNVNQIKDIWNGENIQWCHSMNVPLLLKLDQKDLWYGPYLKPNDAPSNIKSNKIKVGIRWKGNPGYENDLHRSIPLKDLYDILSLYDFQLYSLQKEEGLEELKNYPDIIPLHNISLYNFEETLTEIRDLDLVITSCTSVAHASAAMGKKTVVFVPMSTYYIWCHSGEVSPWYDKHVKILRQKRPRYWEEPMNELRGYLSNEFNCN